jgi:hypothetical protein
MIGTSQCLALAPQINTVLLLGAPMQPRWWVKILTYLHSERLLFIAFYNFVLKLLIIFNALVPNPMFTCCVGLVIMFFAYFSSSLFFFVYFF